MPPKHFIGTLYSSIRSHILYSSPNSWQRSQLYSTTAIRTQELVVTMVEEQTVPTMPDSIENTQTDASTAESQVTDVRSDSSGVCADGTVTPVSPRPRLDYRNKNILAPMVRVGTLPMRLLALHYGADIVYTEELVDWKLLKTTRRVNTILGTVDFVDPMDGNVVFRTCATERDRVVLQMGTCCPERALRVGRLVQNDVAGIDINMGCPKEFSIKGGMGAALMAKPDTAQAILRTLVAGLEVPVTCKIRIFPDVERTLELAAGLAECGIAAITVHGRTRQERPQHPVHSDVIRRIADHLTIPLIANGGSKEISRHAHLQRFRDECGASSVMIARAAQWNPSIFSRSAELTPLDDVIRTFLRISVDYDNNHTNTKYCIQIMLRELQETPRGKQFLECQTLEEICAIWSMAEYCRARALELEERGNCGRRQVVPGNLAAPVSGDGVDDDDVQCSAAKRAKTSDGKPQLQLPSDVEQRNIPFYRAHYASVPELPKSVLYSDAGRQRKTFPVYETQQVDRLFRAVVSYDGRRYANTYWEKNKKNAEQGAALVAILRLGLIEEAVLVQRGGLLK